MAPGESASTALPISGAVEELEDRIAAISDGIRALAEPRKNGGDPHHGFANMLEESGDLREVLDEVTEP